MNQVNAVQILKRQAGIFLLIFVLGIALTAVVVIFAPRKYQSNAKFLLRLGRENVSIDPTASTTGDVTSLHRTRESEVQSTVDGMRSRRILESVIRELGSESILSGALDTGSVSRSSFLGDVKGRIRSWIESLDPIDDDEKAILVLKSGLSIDAEQDSSVIDVSYTTRTPEMAERVVDAWVRACQAEHARISLSEGSFAFFQQQENLLLDNLEKARDELRKRKSVSGILTIDGGQQILERQMEQARLSRTDILSRLAGARARFASLKTQKENTPERVTTGESTALTNDARQQMRDRLYSLEIEERGLSGKFEADHPSVLAIKRQLEDARRIYESYQDSAVETVKGINPLYVTITEQLSLEESSVESLQSELAAIEATLELLERQFRELNEHENELAALQRQVNVMEAQFESQFVKREQARLAEELQETNISNLRLIQDPSLERRPVSPNKPLCAILGLLGSLFAAAGLAVFREARFQIALAAKESRKSDVAEPEQSTPTPSRATVLTPDRRHAEQPAPQGLVSSAREAQ